MIPKQYIIFLLQHQGHCTPQMLCESCPICPCIKSNDRYDYEQKKINAFAKAKKIAIHYLTEEEIFEVCL